MSAKRIPQCCAFALALVLSLSRAFVPLHPAKILLPNKLQHDSFWLRAQEESTVEDTVSLQPVFDFSDSARNETDRFERIDDVIMGGISSSAVRQVSGEPFARWSGVCREDGGGFCGLRTLPFQQELDASDSDGMFLTCRLSSDEEPDRRVWKITTRTEKSRGEQLYQAMFQIPKGDDEEWHSIQIPFEDFRLVRGARLIPNGGALNTSTGLYQIGMTMSKFTIAENMTSIPDFRPGFFELQIKQIGLYKKGQADNAQKEVTSLSREEALAQRPFLLKVLLPLSVIAFTEKSQRRKSAMRILTKERGLTRLQAIRFGLQWRAKQVGIVRSAAKTLSILLADSARQSIRSLIRYGLFVPLKLVFKTLSSIGKVFSKRKGVEAEKASS